MIEISKSQEVLAPVDAVWNLVADLINEHKNWSLLSDVKILSRTGDTVKREVKIRRGPMGEERSVQTLSVDSLKRSTVLALTKGSMLGTRKIVLIKLSEDQTRVDVNWEFQMKGVPGFAMGFVKDNVSDVTEKALMKIKQDAEKAHSYALSLG